MRYLGVDPGGRRLGLAVADGETGVVTPLAVVAVAGLDAMVNAVVEATRRQRSARAVIGLPTDGDGNPTPACRRSEALARRLEAHGLEVALEPELLSSDEARRRARAAGRPRSRPVDDLAAQVILEQYLAHAGER